jgi:hypothetical protein
MLKSLLKTWTILITLLLLAIRVNGESKLVWDAPTNNIDGSAFVDLGGYKVLYGTAPSTYSTTVDVGNVTQYGLSNLNSNLLYYFIVIAYTKDNRLGERPKPLLWSGKLPKSVVIPPSGVYTFPIIITITNSIMGYRFDGIETTMKIGYTIDNTTPTTNSPIYYKPLVFTRPTILKTITWKPNYVSIYTTNSYLGASTPLPIIKFDYELIIP